MKRLLFVLALSVGLAACGKGPCDDLVQQLQDCPHYQQVVQVSASATATAASPVDCEGTPVNDIAQCIIDSGEDICSPDGLARANARCKK